MKHWEIQPFWDRFWLMNETNGKNRKNCIMIERKMKDCPFHTICCTACTSYVRSTCYIVRLLTAAVLTLLYMVYLIDMRRVYRYSVGSNIHHHRAPLRTSIRMFLHEHSRMVAGRLDYSIWQTTWPMLRPPWHQQTWIVRKLDHAISYLFKGTLLFYSVLNTKSSDWLLIGL